MVLMNVPAQLDDNYDQEMPWIIYIEAEDRYVAAFADAAHFRRPLVKLELDAPWLPLSQRIMSVRRYDIALDGQDAPYREKSAERKARLDREWPKHGGEQIDTPQGKRWVLGTELKLARRAHAMAEAASFAAVDEYVGEESAVKGVPRLSFLSAWGTHILVVLGAAVLIGLIFRFVLIDQFRSV